METKLNPAAIPDGAITVDKLTITKSDIGLGNVDNTADSTKSVLKATQDGSGNVISSTYATKSEVENKQATLISGTNIKTINGNSILGSGNITISGSGNSGGSGAYSEVSHGTSDTTFTLTPNVFHVWDEVASLTLTLGDETVGIANEFLFQFNSGSTATTLSLPDTLKWANDSAPTIVSNKIYQISVLKGLASALEFDNTPPLIENRLTVSIVNRGFQVTSQYTVASDVVVTLRINGGNYNLTISEGQSISTINFADPVFEGPAITSISPAEDDTYIYTY